MHGEETFRYLHYADKETSILSPFDCTNKILRKIYTFRNYKISFALNILVEKTKVIQMIRMNN